MRILALCLVGLPVWGLTLVQTTAVSAQTGLPQLEPPRPLTVRPTESRLPTGPQASDGALDKLLRQPPAHVQVQPVQPEQDPQATKQSPDEASSRRSSTPRVANGQRMPHAALPLLPAELSTQQQDADSQGTAEPLADPGDEAAATDETTPADESELRDADPLATPRYPGLGEPLPLEQLGDLRTLLRQTLIDYYGRPESVAQRSPWGIMHGMIGFGVDAQVVVGRGKTANAIGWLSWNGACRNMRLLQVRQGRVSAAVGPGVQGHEGQFLAMLAQSRVPKDYELRVGSDKFTVADLIETEMLTCRPRTELTFKLIALSHYLDSDAEWVSDDGQAWSIQRLIQEEIAQPVLGAACGGTHRLMGLSYAIANRRRDGRPLDGEWERAQTYLNDFVEYAVGLQNRDGSLSTSWFEGREAREDSQRRLQTTGHILEWLIYTLPEEQLRSPEIVRGVAYLTNLMYRERGTDWKIGPLGHAIHALSLYDQRVFGARLGEGGPRLNWELETAAR